MKNKGFTLIELLVVIAIIGILAGIILVAVNLARDRARDARVKEELANLRAAAEVYYVTNKTYVVDFGSGSTVCGDPEVVKLIEDIRGLSGNEASCDAKEDGTGWLAFAHLPSDDAPILISLNPLQFNNAAKLWCADSTGFSGEITLGAFLVSYSDDTCR